jgi:hypothetical protein
MRQEQAKQIDIWTEWKKVTGNKGLKYKMERKMNRVKNKDNKIKVIKIKIIK